MLELNVKYNEEVNKNAKQKYNRVVEQATAQTA
jgi:hypothetical protein